VNQDAILLQIEQLSSDGRGIGRVEGRAVFVAGALPGDEIRGHVDWNATPPTASIHEVVKKSPQRCEHPCAHAQECIGSLWGHLDYAAQCAQKEHIVRHTLRSLQCADAIRTLTSSPHPWHYRQRVTLSVWLNEKQIEIGYKTQPRAARGAAIRECKLAHRDVERALEHIARIFATIDPHALQSLPSKVQIHRTAGGAGALLMFPTPLSGHTVTDWSRILAGDALRGGIWGAEASHAGLIGAASRFFPAPNAQSMLTTWLGRAVELHPAAFCQVNPDVADLISRTLQEYFKARSFTRIWDFYGGWGMLGLSLANRRTPLTILEVSPHGEATARTLAAAGSGPEIYYRRGDLLKTLPGLSRFLQPADLIILDPPKSGAHQDVLRAIGSSPVNTLAYLSCNIAKLTRDLPKLLATGFEIRAVFPFDMFPNTTSIEALVILERSRR
jgi:23S rRNA (uracil1939-C5)-methyltransferase